MQHFEPTEPAAKPVELPVMTPGSVTPRPVRLWQAIVAGVIVVAIAFLAVTLTTTRSDLSNKTKHLTQTQTQLTDTQSQLSDAQAQSSSLQSQLSSAQAQV